VIAFGIAVVPTAGADAAINRASRASVGGAYRAVLAPALATPVGWTGSVSGCVAGTTSLSSKVATLAAVNFARKLAGLTPVSLSAAYTTKAQKAALVFKANSTSTSLFLTHDLQPTAKCYSNDAKIGAQSSNIAASTDGTVAGAKGVIGYLDEPGSGNTAVGHRRWILSPDLAWIGAGSTSTTNALYVTGARAKIYANPSWVTWPTSGYFPSQLEPLGRWSISGKQGVRYDFSRATVSVVDGGGHQKSVTLYRTANGYTYADTLVFRLTSLSKPLGTRAVSTYTVTVKNVKRGSATLPAFTYTVRFFDPTQG
jgi:uncharacterized protein YkwD